MNVKEDLEAAALCYRCLWRLTEYYENSYPGPPKYPSTETWGLLEDYLVNLEDQEEEKAELLIPLSLRINGTTTPIIESGEGGHE